MQVMYYKTKNFIRHEGNVIDLVQYRQKLAAVSGGDCVAPTQRTQEEPAPVLRVLPSTSAPARKGRSLVDQMELCATLGVITMTLVAVVQFAIF